MPYRVEWSRKAEQDLIGILVWFRSQAASSAGDRWFKGIQLATKSLEHNPTGYPLAGESEELDIKLHEMHFGRRGGQYRVLFVVERRTVLILHVRHAARDSLTWSDL